MFLTSLLNTIMKIPFFVFNKWCTDRQAAICDLSLHFGSVLIAYVLPIFRRFWILPLPGGELRKFIIFQAVFGIYVMGLTSQRSVAWFAKWRCMLQCLLQCVLMKT